MNFNAGAPDSPEKNALSESGGAQGGAMNFEDDSVGQIQRQTLAALRQSLGCATNSKIGFFSLAKS